MAEEVKTQKRKRSGKTIWTIVLILAVAVGIYAFIQYLVTISKDCKP